MTKHLTRTNIVLGVFLLLQGVTAYSLFQVSRAVRCTSVSLCRVYTNPDVGRVDVFIDNNWLDVKVLKP